MAVQAQYPPSKTFSPDFRSRSRNDVFEELQMLQGRDIHMGNLLGAYTHHTTNGGTVFSDPQSELTCNAVSQSRKRSRDHTSSMAMSQAQVNPHQLPFPVTVTLPAKSAAMSHEQSRMYGSVGTSTSGRPPVVSAASPIVSPLTPDLVSCLYQQNVEIDALVCLQTERLRSGLEEARKKHCRALLSVVEQQVVHRLTEKEAELEDASLRNAELEEKVRQLSAENQIWFNVAKNNEAIVSSLRTTLEQVLQNATPATALPEAEEGYGDSGGEDPFPADDARSCCFEEAKEEERKVAMGDDAAVAVRRENEEHRGQTVCRVCREREVSVLLLPCRHLCLCKDCESRLDTCPVCHTTKNASLQIFMC